MTPSDSTYKDFVEYNAIKTNHETFPTQMYHETQCDEESQTITKVDRWPNPPLRLSNQSHTNTSDITGLQKQECDWQPIKKALSSEELWGYACSKLWHAEKEHDKGTQIATMVYSHFCDIWFVTILKKIILTAAPKKTVVLFLARQSHPWEAFHHNKY